MIALSREGGLGFWFSGVRDIEYICAFNIMILPTYDPLDELLCLSSVSFLERIAVGVRRN